MSAMCALAFFSFLRIGKLTAYRGNTTKTTNIINVSQLDRLVGAQGRIRALQLTLYNPKHKNSEPPFVIFI